MSTMQEILKRSGFVDVTWTISMDGDFCWDRCKRDAIVTPDVTKAKMQGTSNGTFVVWDDEGHPWIKRGYRSMHDIKIKLRKIGIEIFDGVRVPHSNDGGMICGFFFPYWLDDVPPAHWTVTRVSLPFKTPLELLLIKP